MEEEKYGANPNADKKGLAIAALVLGILAIVVCGCGAFIFAPISIILAIVSLATHRGAKPAAIIGLVLSVISILVIVLISTAYREPIEDFSKFMNNSEQYVEMYKATGEVPEEFQKYKDPKYDDVWKGNNMKSFDEFYAYLIESVDPSRQQAPSGTTVSLFSDAFTDMNFIQAQAAV
ncbi:MAG: DUF4190 domain-containing protein [Ruminococcus sp.]|nr:DUF4190 domain-containing protein [Ruminococcus sp.]